MVKTGRERQRELRKKKREAGLISKEIWVYPEIWEEIQAFIEFKNSSILEKKRKSDALYYR